MKSIKPWFLVLCLACAPAFAEEEQPQQTEEQENEGSEANENENENENDSEPFLTEEMVEKLSPDQLASILHEREQSQNGGTVAWLSSLAFFVVLLGSVAIASLAVVRVQRERQETLRQTIAKGLTPAALLTPPSRERDLRRGLLLIATGVGIAVSVGLIAPDPSWAAVAALPGALGIGHLLTWRLSSKRTPSGAAVSESPTA
jgi:hypothetical protein